MLLKGQIFKEFQTMEIDLSLRTTTTPSLIPYEDQAHARLPFIRHVVQILFIVREISPL